MVASVAWGALLGYRKMWLHLLISALCGTGVLLFGCAVVMIATASPDDTTVDNAAGAGVAIFSVPTLITVGALLFLGGGLGALVRRRMRTRKTRPSVKGSEA